jgi:hypothetical protein
MVNLFTDLLTTVVPMPLIWRLKLPRRQRLVVIAIFGLGITVDIVGSVRTYYVWQDAVGTWDSTWYAWLVGMTGAVEIHVGIVRFSPFPSIYYTNILTTVVCIRPRSPPSCQEHLAPFPLNRQSHIVRPKRALAKNLALRNAITAFTRARHVQNGQRRRRPLRPSIVEPWQIPWNCAHRRAGDLCRAEERLGSAASYGGAYFG